MEARLAGTGSLSRLASEPGDPVGKPVPGRGEWLGAKREGGKGQRMLGAKGSFLTSQSWWRGSRRRSCSFSGIQSRRPSWKRTCQARKTGALLWGKETPSWHLSVGPRG